MRGKTMDVLGNISSEPVSFAQPLASFPDLRANIFGARDKILITHGNISDVRGNILITHANISG